MIVEENDICSRIREFRESQNLSRPEMATRLGISKHQRLADVENGRQRPPTDLLQKIMEIFHVRPEWLMEGKLPIFKTEPDLLFENSLNKLRETTDSVANLAISDERKRQVRDILYAVASGATNLIEQAFSAVQPEGFVLVPRYDVTGSMGNGRVIHSEQIVDHLAFRAEWVRTELGTSPKNLVLISAVGDSMEPALRAHDLLLIDRSVLTVNQDAIYAFAVDGELRVKRIQRLFDGSLIIKSDNPSYATETLTEQQAETINLVGRVVWSGRRM